MEKWMLTFDNDVIAVFDNSEDAFNEMYKLANRLADEVHGWLDDKTGLTLNNDNPEINVEGYDHVCYKYEVIRFNKESIVEHSDDHDDPAVEFMGYCKRHGVGDKDEDDDDLGNLFEYVETKGEL